MPDQAIAKRRAANQFTTEHDLIEAIEEGAVLRVRPKAMTVAVIVAGFLSIMFRQRHWLGGHAQNRGTHGWRHDHCATSIDAGVTGTVLVAASARDTEGFQAMIGVSSAQFGCGFSQGVPTSWSTNHEIAF
jgi:hypothetical protein